MRNIKSILSRSAVCLAATAMTVAVTSSPASARERSCTGENEGAGQSTCTTPTLQYKAGDTLTYEIISSSEPLYPDAPSVGSANYTIYLGDEESTKGFTLIGNVSREYKIPENGWYKLEVSSFVHTVFSSVEGKISNDQ